MPVTRDKDGNVLDEKTVAGDDRTVKVKPSQFGGTPEPQDEEGSDYDARTVMVGGSPSASAGTDDERTRVVGGRRRTERVRQMHQRAEVEDSMDDPVVGWLVVVDGPGKGRSLSLGYGTNSIGRAANERVSVNFGDDQISRQGHAVVTYDPRGRKFYLQQGGGTNLVYLDEHVVLAPIELPPLAHIHVGNTILRFMPLCGDAFDWQDTGKDEAS